MGYRSKTWCAILWSLCLLFLQVQGASELSRAGIVSGGGVGSAGQYQVLTSIGQPYATALLQGNTSSGGSGLLAGLENSPVSDLAGQLKGIEDELLVMTHTQLLTICHPTGGVNPLLVRCLARHFLPRTVDNPSMRTQL